jgi:antagonist of KipI
MGLLFLTNNLLTTVQDLGRNGSRALGINPNGAMDRFALRMINVLLGNKETEAALEIHFPAPKILFEESAVIALGGADFGAELDDQPFENWQIIPVEKGQTLSFTRKNWGNRLYLSVKGGFKIDEWLGSQSTNLKARIGGFEGRGLQKDDRLKFKVQGQKSKVEGQLRISPYFLPYRKRSNLVRVIAGAEFDLLTPHSSENFLKKTFQITQNSDRMGYRLSGEPLYLLHEKELVSSAVTFGTIQLLPNGQMIILMADHQTTGGYPRIANVIAQDLPVLAQRGTNDKVYFELISLEAAETLAVKFERELNFLKTGVKFRGGF